MLQKEKQVAFCYNPTFLHNRVRKTRFAAILHNVQRQGRERRSRKLPRNKHINIAVFRSVLVKGFKKLEHRFKLRYLRRAEGLW